MLTVDATLLTVTVNESECESPSSSVTVTVTVYVPSSAYVCVPDMGLVAGSTVSAAEPSPQSKVAVCVSPLPASVKVGDTVRALPVRRSVGNAARGLWRRRLLSVRTERSQPLVESGDAPLPDLVVLLPRGMAHGGVRPCLTRPSGR